MSKLSAKVKLAAVREVIEDKKSFKEVTSKYNCSRQSLYFWAKKYSADPKKGAKSLENSYKKGKNHAKALSWQVEKRILDSVIKQPHLSVFKISDLLSETGIKVSSHGVHNVLTRFNLQTKELRERFSVYHPVKTVFAHALAPAHRAKVVEEFLEGKAPIAKVCKKWKVSRPTFYAWLATYKKAIANEAQVVEALIRKYKKGSEHHLATSYQAEEAVLDLIRQNPGFSAHKLAQNLKGLIGHHGIQNILARNEINTYEARLRWVQSQYIPEPVPVPVEAPVLPRSRLLRLIAHFRTIPKLVWRQPITWPFVLPILLFVAYIFELDQAFRPTVIFPIIALTFGFVFFLYSLKYYASLILVLWLGSKAQEKDRGTGSLNPDTGSGQNKSNPVQILQFQLRRVYKNTVERYVKKVYEGKGVGLSEDLSGVTLSRFPFVSVHLPLYNEKRVVERVMKACSSFDWSRGSQPNYEVIVIDDSTDETTEIALKALADDGWKVVKSTIDNRLATTAKPNNDTVSSKPDTVSGSRELELFYATKAGNPLIKYVHRFSRAGFKGGALAEALRICDARAEYILVFDADFVPYPDTIEQFVKYFQLASKDESLKTNAENKALDLSHSSLVNRIAAVQGYQWHVLNKSENWITRGVRSEYAGSYVVERSAIELYGGLKMIAGSVYAIRADVLRTFGWGKSITEDFELTLRLYAAGYKVVYTPYIQAPAEAVSTIRRMIRQRMRWAEGHSFNIRHHIQTIINSRHLTFSEKFEFAFLGPYYLQAAFFVVGTLAWFLSETVLHVSLPYWTAALGWSLVFTNFLALPLINLLGLFLEQSEEKDYLGVASFILLSYIVTPFQAYAAVKGFLEKEEGPWFRTPKSGKVTDVVGRVRIGHWTLKLPFGRPEASPIQAAENITYNLIPSPLLNLSGYGVKTKRLAWASRAVIAFLLIITLSLNYLVVMTPSVKAAGTTPALVQEINIADQEGATTSASYVDCTSGQTGSCGFVDWDSTKYDGTTLDVFFEAVLREETGTGALTTGVGLVSSIALSSSNPVIAYYDQASGDLKVAFCNDVNCANSDAGETTVVVDGCSTCSTNGNVGENLDMIIDTARVHIAYYDNLNDNLKYAQCLLSVGIASCDTAGEWTVSCLVGDSAQNCLSTDTDNVGISPAIVVQTDNGLDHDSPAVAYRDVTNTNVDFVRCSDDTCTGIDTGFPICIAGGTGCFNTTAVNAGTYIGSKTIPNSNLVIAYHDETTQSGDPRLARCTWDTTSPCANSGDWTNNEVDDRSGSNTNTEANDQGQGIDVVLDASGFPVLSFYDQTAADLIVAHCGDVACAGTNETINAPDTAAVVSQGTAIALNTGNPTIFYGNGPAFGPMTLSVMDCDDANCAGTEGAEYFFGSAVKSNVRQSMVLDSGGKPVLSFGSREVTGGVNSGNLIVIPCGDVACAGENDLPNFPDMNADKDGSSRTATVGLFDSGGTQVTCSGSNVEVTRSKREFARVRTSCDLATMTSGNYTVRLKTSNTDSSARMFVAKLIIIQADPTKLTKSSGQAEVGDLQTGITGTSYANITDTKFYCFNDTNASTCSATGDTWTPDPTVEFHATLNATSSGDTAFAELFDGTSQVAEATTTNATWTRAEDTTVTLTAGAEYRVRVKCSDGGDAGTTCSASIANAKIVFDQSDATNGISALELVQTYNSYTLGGFNNSYSIYRYNSELDVTDISGTETYFFENSMSVSNAAGTVNAELFNLSDGSSITGSEISSQSTSLTRVRSSSIASGNLPASSKEMAVRQKCGSGCAENIYTHENTIGHLITQIASLPVPEYALFAAPGVLFLPKLIRWFQARKRRKRKKGAGNGKPSLAVLGISN